MTKTINSNKKQGKAARKNHQRRTTPRRNTNRTVANMADKDPNDIRKWLSPKSSSSTPNRRRRVMSTSSSDNERQESEQNTARQTALRSPAHPPNAPASSNVAPQQSQSAGTPSDAQPIAEDVIELSSSEDSTFIYRACPRPAGGAAKATPTRQAVNQRKGKGGQPRRSRRDRERARGGTTPNKKRKFTAEAEEASTDYSESDSCAESEQNAQDLYHEAMMGVRKANHARTQLRSATINCPVCAKFAAYLQHFTS
jgi:hypothetical protein